MESLKSLITKDPWLAHIPLPRVIDILVENISSSKTNLTDEQLIKIIPELCVASANSPHRCQEILKQIPRSSNVWKQLVETIEREGILSHLHLIEIYKQRSSALIKHILESFDVLSYKSINCLNKLIEKNADISDNKIFSDFLSHKCSDTGSNSTWNLKYYFLPNVIISSKDFIDAFFLVSKLFLENTNYSLTSIKVVHIFYSLIKFASNRQEQLLESYGPINELSTLLTGPPCLSCNKLLSSDSDLESIVKEVKNILLFSGDCNIRIFRTIICMHCDWLIHMKNCPEVRSLFIQLNYFS